MFTLLYLTATETGDDAAYLQATTEELTVSRLMC